MANIPQSWFDEEHDELRELLIDIMTGRVGPLADPSDETISTNPNHFNVQDTASSLPVAVPRGYELELIIAVNTTIRSKQKKKRAKRKVKTMDDLWKQFAKYGET